MAITKEQLEEYLEELSEIRGRHTELVSVYVPAGFNLNVVAKQLEAEKSTATNIKSKTTRSNVLEALEKIIRALKLYKKTPENGLAIFSGNISKKDGQPDIRVWEIEPPKKLKTRTYRCDQEFVLEPLQEIIAVEEVYGLLVMDRKQATIGLLEGKHIKVLRKMTSGVPGKIRAGGQSSQRFERITEGKAKEFFKKVAENMKELFFDMPKLKGLLIGGPIPTKEEFLEQGQLVTKLKEKVMAVKDIGDTDESGLSDLVEAAQEDLASQEIIKEKKLLERFFMFLGKHKDKSAYGLRDVKKALKYGAVKELLLSKKLDKPIIKELTKMANGISAETHIVSIDTEEGQQFWNLKGIGAILRFAV